MWLNKSRKYKGYLRDASNVYWLKVIFTHLKTHMSCFSFPRQWTNFCYLSPCLGTLAVYALHVIEEINGIQLKSIFLKWKFFVLFVDDKALALVFVHSVQLQLYHCQCPCDVSSHCRQHSEHFTPVGSDRIGSCRCIISSPSFLAVWKLPSVIIAD